MASEDEVQHDGMQDSFVALDGKAEQEPDSNEPPEPDDKGRLSEPLTPELQAKLQPKAKTYKAGGRGYANTTYIEVAQEVHETGVGRTHLERDFPRT
jgi:hypothetical protein